MGIDYGNGLTNRNLKNGIRFGVIPIQDTGDCWYDSSEPFYPNVCPHCGNEPKSKKPIQDYIRCPSCRKTFKQWDFDNQESTACICTDSDYEAHSDEYNDIFILSSPFYTYADFCSPCAPGACYLRSPLTEKNENNKAYCFGHDFFPDNKAPYVVYSVETNEVINP